MRNFMNQLVCTRVTFTGKVFKLKQFLCTSTELHEKVCIWIWNEKLAHNWRKAQCPKRWNIFIRKMLFFIIRMAKHKRPHLRSGHSCVKLFISKIVYISLSRVFVFSSKRRFLPQPEFMNKVQEPFGQILHWVSQVKVAWRRETVKVIICGEVL